jgi:polyphosphate kinase 2 (PPK2 family)
VSKDEQKQRFLDRIEEPNKNWKFSSGDLAERKLWDNYMKAYEDAINETATKHAPWYIIPADKKWYTRLTVSQIIADKLKEMKLTFPSLPKAELALLAEYKKQLLEE